MTIDRLSKNFSKLCIIGMSGVGKSSWAQKFKEYGYQTISCDDLICEHILHKIGTATEVISCLGTWLGFPWQEDFEEKEKTYLELEDDFMNELSSKDYNSNTLLDSTGSLIYCSQETLQQIKENFLIIYFKLDSQQTEKILHNYCTNPRPILWNNNFPKDLHAPETKVIEQQLALLIKEREKRYQDLADITIFKEELEACQNASELLDIIKKRYEHG